MVEQDIPKGFDPYKSIVALAALCRLFSESRDGYIVIARGFNHPVVNTFINEILPDILAHDENAHI